MSRLHENTVNKMNGYTGQQCIDGVSIGQYGFIQIFVELWCVGRDEMTIVDACSR